MSIIFNLKKTLEQIRLAMPKDWFAYRDQLTWWRLDEIEKGNEEWNKLVKGDPQNGIPPNKDLVNVLADARNIFYTKQAVFRARYGVSKDQVDSFYKMFIGYNPLQGAMALGIGPYTAGKSAWGMAKKEAIDRNLQFNKMSQQELLQLSESIPLPELPEGFDPLHKDNKDNPLAKDWKSQTRKKRAILEVRADKTNKFGYFLKTYNRVTPELIQKNRQAYLKKLSKAFGNMFGPEDLMADMVAFPPDAKTVGKVEGNVSQYHNYYDVTDQSSLFIDPPLLGTGCKMRLNPKGFHKLCQNMAKTGGWTDLYYKAIEDIAKANEMPVEEIEKLVMQDIGFAKMFQAQLKSIRKSLKKAGDFRADFINFLDMKEISPPVIGAQAPQTHRISRAQYSIVKMKIEILKTVVDLNTEDPNQIAESLNARRVQRKSKIKAKAKWNGEIVTQWLNAIKAEDQAIQKLKHGKRVRSYKDIYESTVQEFQEIQDDEQMRDAGQDDLATVMRIASTTMMKSEEDFIDPIYRTKIQFANPPDLFAREGDMDVPITAKFLTNLRVQARTKGTEEEAFKFVQEQINIELGNIEKANPEIVKGGIKGVLKKDDDEETSEGEGEGAEGEGAEGMPAGETPAEDFPITEIPQEKTPTTPPTPPTPPTPTAPEATPEPEEEQQDDMNFKPLIDLKNLVGSTVKSLIIMARDLDSQGKGDSAEEIHKIIRKYQKDI